MPSLQFLIDNLCAAFTEQSMFDLVKGLLAERRCTMDDVALRITERDRSLDIASARQLADAAVAALTERGAIAVQGATITLAAPPALARKGSVVAQTAGMLKGEEAGTDGRRAAGGG